MSTFNELVRLTCWTCARPFSMRRRQGQYPNRCAHCTATDTLARHLRRRARLLGLRSGVERHAEQGYVCVVETPWHDALVIVRDDTDLEYLAAELGTRAQAVAA